MLNFLFITLTLFCSKIYKKQNFIPLHFSMDDYETDNSCYGCDNRYNLTQDELNINYLKNIEKFNLLKKLKNKKESDVNKLEFIKIAVKNGIIFENDESKLLNGGLLDDWEFDIDS